MNKLKTIFPVLFLFWIAIILAAFFITQKPIIAQAIPGFISFSWTLLIFLFITVGASAVGYQLLNNIALNGIERLLLGAGIGLGAFGLAGFGLAACGWAKWPVLIIILIGLFLIQVWRGILTTVLKDIRLLATELRESSRNAEFWMPAVSLAALLLTFLLALAPPADGFDALLYHLSVPAIWLRDGGFKEFNMSTYWYPALIEGLFVWPLALGSDVVTQLLHLLFGILTLLLVWFWARMLWGDFTGWWALTLSLTMPALLWLATWAYNDLALMFFSLAMLYSLWKWAASSNSRWLIIAGVMAALAMGVKYTSFIVPIVAGIFILIKSLPRHSSPFNWQKGLSDIILFGTVTVLIASPWYVRNWLWMHNPVYPFVFGGPFWDTLRANWYTAKGTGIGWNLTELVMLPLNVTLNYREASNLVDGRIGPFFLLLSPVILIIFWKAFLGQSDSRRTALSLVAVFSLSSIAFWVLGVINTARLWQARYLLPGLIPLTLPMSLAVSEIRKLDLPKLRISFIFSTLVGLVIFVALLDLGLLILVRNPLMAAFGFENRHSYLMRFQTGYAMALDLVEKTPPDAKIYILFEPRIYGMERDVQPDPINDNLAHDLALYKNAETILHSWQERGYTHVLLFCLGLEHAQDSGFFADAAVWQEASRLEQLLTVVATSPNNEYVLFAVPSK